MKTFYVSIDKVYFKEEIKVNKNNFGGIFETVIVKAYCPTDAIKNVWAKHGKKWLAMMEEKQTSKRIISLYVTQDKHLNRLIPFKAYED